MRKFTVGICMVILAGALTACGAGTQESSPAESIETEAAETVSSEAAEEEITGEAAEETSSAAEEAASTEETSSAEETSNAEETGYVSGTLTSLGTETLGLTLEDGTKMEFSMESTVLDTEADLTEGLTVTVSYQETEAGFEALYLTDAPTVTGEVVDGTMASVRIRLEDGTEMLFDKQEANVDLKDGLVIGNQITVAYRENGDSAESGFYLAVMIRDAD